MSSTNQSHLADGLLYDKKTSDSLHLLLENISSLNQAVELQSVLKESIGLIERVMNVEASSLMLLDKSTGELIVSMPTGPVQKEISGERIKKGTGVGGWVIENEKPYYSNDLENSEIFAGDLSEDFKSRNIICVPLKDKKDQVFGVLQAVNRLDDRDFDDNDVSVFQALANHVAIAIERTRELEKVQNQLKEKEMMLTEVHHRLKNNLSTITALIEMELSNVEDENAALVLKKTASRIGSMTEVHDFLYNNSLGNEINLGSYIEGLAEKISKILSHSSQQVSIDVKAESIQIDTERAMSCGLLLNELMVNCYKHAFKNKSEDGRIVIELLQSDSTITLKVSDNGIGVEKDFSIEDSSSIGGWLINVLLRRLEAAVDITQSNGTTFIVRFKK